MPKAKTEVTEEVVQEQEQEQEQEQPTGEPVAQEIHSDTATRQYHERNDAIKKLTQKS